MQELLAEQLRKANRRVTNQRRVIFEQVNALNCHPTAAEVFGAVQGLLPGVSLATVYRNLNTLREEGLLREVNCDRGVIRFDPNLSDHYHFLCGSCRKVSDLSGHSRDLERKFGDRTGLHISGHQITFHGICNRCRKVGE